MHPFGRTALQLFQPTHRAYPKIEFGFRADAIGCNAPLSHTIWGSPVPAGPGRHASGRIERR